MTTSSDLKKRPTLTLKSRSARPPRKPRRFPDRKIRVIRAIAKDLANVPDEKFDMRNWYTGFDHYDEYHRGDREPGSLDVSADKFLKACGTAACFAGWLPVLPAAQAEAKRMRYRLLKDDGSVCMVKYKTPNEVATYKHDAEHSVALLLGIEYMEASALTTSGWNMSAYRHRRTVREITRQDVIDVLNKLANDEVITTRNY